MSTSNKIRRVFQDVTHLSSQFYLRRPTTLIESRHILQQNANSSVNRDQNSLAIALLKLDKEIVYMKYEGISQYCMKRFRENVNIQFLSQGKPTDIGIHTNTNSSTSTSNENAGTNSNNTAKSTGTTSNNSKKARIAFMITTAQKQTLARKFNYAPSLIKKLKPIEALLIIENELHSHDVAGEYESGSVSEEASNADFLKREKEWRIKLDDLIEENETLIQRHQEEEEERQRIEESKKIEVEVKSKSKPTKVEATSEESSKACMYEVVEVIQSLTSPSSPISTSTALVLSTSLPESSPSPSETVPASASTPASIDNPPSGSTSDTGEVLALYKTEKEAQEFIDIKLDLRQKRHAKKKSQANIGDEGVASRRETTIEYRIQKRYL